MVIQLNKEIIKKMKSLGVDYLLNDKALKDMKEDDRRFLMSVAQQDINFIAHREQFRLSLYHSYFAVFIALIALFFSIKSNVIFIYATIFIFIIGAILLHKQKQTEDLQYINSIKTYNHIRNIHFSYLKGKIKIK